jgi:hypothetical protein
MASQRERKIGQSIPSDVKGAKKKGRMGWVTGREEKRYRAEKNRGSDEI